MKMKIFYVGGETPLGTLQSSVDEWLKYDSRRIVHSNQTVKFGPSGIEEILLIVFYN